MRLSEAKASLREGDLVNVRTSDDGPVLLARVTGEWCSCGNGKPHPMLAQFFGTDEHKPLDELIYVSHFSGYRS